MKHSRRTTCPRKFSCLLILLCFSLVLLRPRQAEAETHAVLLITMDGLRWQELFTGADARLIDGPDGGVRDAESLRERFWDDDAEARRQRLMPFFWSTVARQGQVFGDPAHGSEALVRNGRFFSYPGYNEILSGFGDPRIDSNDKVPNPNVTVLEWLHRKPQFEGRIAAFASWDVFPFIINLTRSKIPVFAAWEVVTSLDDSGELRVVRQLADEVPHIWPGVCYDVFTFRAAKDYLERERPRVLYVALGETDDWAHQGRYDLYLDAAWRNDRYIQQLWETAQAMPEYAGRTTLVLTTDHGRGDIRDGWKNHGVNNPGSDRIWIAVMGPDTPPRGIRSDTQVTQGQVAATVAALLGEDFAASDERIAPPLPGVLEGGE